jgi:hypothetical protein
MRDALPAQLRCAARTVAIVAAERNEVFRVASFRVPRGKGRQKPAFGAVALSRLVRSRRDFETGAHFCPAGSSLAMLHRTQRIVHALLVE